MLSDTSPQAEKVQIELLRRTTAAERLRRTFSMTALVMQLSRRAIARAHPNLSEEERGRKFIEVQYGKDLAQRIRAWMGPQGSVLETPFAERGALVHSEWGRVGMD